MKMDQTALDASDIIILDDDAVDDSKGNEVNKLNAQKENIHIQSSESVDNRKKNYRKRGFCVNTRCKSNNKGILKYCPLDILRFYKVNVDINSKLYICNTCFEKAANAIGIRIDMLCEGKCLYDNKKNIDDELYAISDSDDESEAGMEIDTGISEDVDEFFQQNIQNVIEEMFDKLDVAKQINGCVDILLEKKNKLEEKADKIDEEIKKITKFAKEVESVYYNTFKKKIENIGEVLIDDLNPDRGTTILPSNATVKSPVKQTFTVKKQIASSNHPNYITSTGLRYPMQQINNYNKPTPIHSVAVLESFKLHSGDLCYARKSDSMMSWSRARIVRVISTGNPAENKFSILEVSFKSSSDNKNNLSRQVNGKQVACPLPSPVRLPTGTRVIAICKDASMRRDSFFAGIVAEPPLSANRHRYLIFFDDGYAQYVEHSRIRKIMESSVCVWEDVNKNSTAFIHKYLKNYPERPMVRTEVGQIMRTEYAGSWCKTRVVALDASLVQMYFVDNNRSEWIYRGSTRLAPLYLEIQAADNRRDGKHRPMHIVRKNQNMPYVEYTRVDDNEVWSNIPHSNLEGIKNSNNQVAAKQTVSINKAKKSTTSVLAKNQQLMEPQAVKPPYEGSQGKVIFYRAKTPMEIQKFKFHQCGKSCLRELPYSLKGYSPLSKPLLSGWQRVLLKGKAKKVVVIYRSPCGRRLRNMKELHSYLRLTGCDLGVDCFDFDSWVHCLAEFVLERYKLLRDDLSNGMESMPVPCVNYYDHDMPEYSSYSTIRIPTEGVNLNLDEEFLCGCDCEDDCQDKTKCSCWKLTIEGAKCIQPELAVEEIGYQYRRLLEPVTTGIYECNSRCKCSATCLNRVAQRPLQEKLQVFKTKDRGWGIRCMNDLPQGTFICIYAGNLLTEQMANAGGAAYGDEYFAELDYIEVVEKLKEGYEEDVINPELEQEKTSSTPDELEDDDDEEFEDYGSMTRDSDEEFLPGFSHSNNTAATVSTRLSKKKNDSVDVDNTGGPLTAKTSSEDLKSTIDIESTNANDKLKIKPDPDAQDLESRLSTWDLDSIECITISDEEEPLREPSSFAPTQELQQTEEQSEYKSFRLLYGEEEYCYVMDAKTIGNIGRYLNHSCNPNVFVQNVFVDTHDLRFPWVAFFALTFIRAGTELTWNYNYDVNSVPGKVMYCKCGASVCRGRLL